MKAIIYIFFLLAMVFSATASNVATAEVHVEVINNPPEIMDIKTSEPFENQPLSCDVAVKDEIENVQIKYIWYNNDVLLEGQEDKALSPIFFKEGDTVTCVATPNDLVQDGETKTLSVVITPEPVSSMITGAVIGVGKNVGFLNTFLILLLLALVIFNVAYFSRKK